MFWFISDLIVLDCLSCLCGIFVILFLIVCVDCVLLRNFLLRLFVIVVVFVVVVVVIFGVVLVVILLRYVLCVIMFDGNIVVIVDGVF